MRTRSHANPLPEGRKHCGVLQIEPTDHCNLRCEMCAPHQRGEPTIHGSCPRGFMPIPLFQRVVDGLVASPVCFDHLIFQWMGEPTLHPDLPAMLAYAHAHIRDRFQYFRIDTNGIQLTPATLEALLEVYSTDPTFPLLLVFSLDACTLATWQRVKGGTPEDFAQVQRNLEHFLRRRAALPFPGLNVNLELQFVLQPGNAHEAKTFVEHWDSRLDNPDGRRGYNEIMIKRLSVAAGGAGQRRADDLYDFTVRTFDLTPFDKPHLHLKVWETRTWARDSDQPPPQTAPGEAHQRTKAALASLRQQLLPPAHPADPASEGSCASSPPSGPPPHLHAESDASLPPLQATIGQAPPLDVPPTLEASIPARRPPCPALWKTPVVRWDGELTVCCADLEASLSLGNLADHTFAQLWFGQKARELRACHLEGRQDSLEKCRHCGGIAFYTLHEEDLEEAPSLG